MKLSPDQESALNTARTHLQRAMRLMDALFEDNKANMLEEDELEEDLREAIDKCEAAKESLEEARIQ